MKESYFMSNYYPVMLDVRGRLAIVIGGNRIAVEKASALASCGASVRVISAEFCEEMQELKASGQVSLVQKSYEPGDLADAFLVVAAINEQSMIEEIWQETSRRGQPVNIVDVPRYCSFILPSILRRGQLTIAVSTAGASPSLAKRIRQQLEETFPASYSLYIDLAALARGYLRRQGVSYERRDAFFADFMASPVLTLLEEQRLQEVLATVSALLESYGVRVGQNELAREFLEERGHVEDTV